MSKMKEHMMSMMEVELDNSGYDAWVEQGQREDEEFQMEENNTVVCDVCGKEVKRSFTVENEYIELCKNCFKE